MASSESTPRTGVKIGFGKMVVWGIASLGLSTISGVYGALLSIFYNDHLGLVDSGPWVVVVVAIAYAVWNALNDNGQSVPTGIYFCKMTAENFRQIRKLTLMK